jgi:hypothetical protein
MATALIEREFDAEHIRLLDRDFEIAGVDVTADLLEILHGARWGA